MVVPGEREVRWKPPLVLLEVTFEFAVGHLGKRVMCALDFGGAGHNTSALGVSLTMFSIEVIQVSLINVGTQQVKSAAIATGCIPFLEGGTMMSPEQKAVLDPPLDANGFVLLAGALK
jgi:hypothetical protein